MIWLKATKLTMGVCLVLLMIGSLMAAVVVDKQGVQVADNPLMQSYVWLLGGGWLLLAFGVGRAFERIGDLQEQVRSMVSNSTAIAVLDEKVDRLTDDVHRLLNEGSSR